MFGWVWMNRWAATTEHIFGREKKPPMKDYKIRVSIGTFLFVFLFFYFLLLNHGGKQSCLKLSLGLTTKRGKNTQIWHVNIMSKSMCMACASVVT